ncbi:MAG: hypothetical protein HY335_02870, partial [Deinococcus sp.]|nr:hypothetical protein [Deinococcus sp.]
MRIPVLTLALALLGLALGQVASANGGPVAFFSNATSQSVEVTAFDGSTFTFQTSFGTLSTPAEGVLALQLAELPEGAFAVPTLVLVDGQQLAAELLTIADGTFTFSTDVGTLTVSEEHIVAIFLQPVVVSEGAVVVSMDEFEPNDELALATPKAVSSATFGTTSPGDVDIFSLPAQSGDRVRLEVFSDREGQNTDTTLTLLSPTGREVGSNDDTVQLDPKLERLLEESGTYYLVLRNLSGSGSYRLLITTPPPPQSEPEPNDSP